MKLVSHFPHEIIEIENVWIPLSDGTRLAAKIWLPKDAKEHSVPAILEYLPYRKDDGTTVMDTIHHRYFAGHGYAAIRVDLRGTGDSDGILQDEYLRQEQQDALEVLRWIAAQSWCTGAVGMYGISWGGFNALQVAALRPPELKAIITMCSTDDRYRDDCHYMGGCLLASDMLKWASVMLAYNAAPPDPRFVGRRWRKIWFERMKHTPPYSEAWLSHQRLDAYWKHGSVNQDYSRIACPVFLVGGWADSYVDSIPRLLEHLSAPRKAIIGPWAHTRPEVGAPGPAIDFLKECVRWWDEWLKGKPSGIMKEPLMRFWLEKSDAPSPTHATWPGKWQAESEWPPKTVHHVRYWLGQNTLMKHQGKSYRFQIQSNQYAGLDGGVWCPSGTPGDFPPDQRFDEALSTSFTTTPLKKPLTLLGNPTVTLRLAANQPIALVAVRLCDVNPHGASTRISWGLLNLTHRESDERPTPLTPKKLYTIHVQLTALGYELAPGHRLRLDISPNYWPHAWPSPTSSILSLSLGKDCFIDLPVRKTTKKQPEVMFGESHIAPPPLLEVLRAPVRKRDIHRDPLTGVYQLIDFQDTGWYRLTACGLEREEVFTDTYTIQENDPLSATIVCNRLITVGRGRWRTKVKTKSTLTCDKKSFFVSNTLNAYEGKKRVFQKTWNRIIPRDGI